MNKYRKSDSPLYIGQNGITLIELLIVLALLGVVLTAGFSFMLFGNRSFKISEERAENQFDVRMPVDFVSKEVRYADSVQLLTATPTPVAGTFDIYLDAGQLKYNKDLIATTIPGSTGVSDYKFSVNRISNKNILTYTIGKTGTTKYDVTTQVIVLNASAADITGTGPAVGLRFTLNKVITGASATIDSIIDENPSFTVNQYSVYSMPSTVGVNMSDGSTGSAVVSWSNTIYTDTTGLKTSQGTVSGYSAKKVNLSVTVNGVTITGLIDPAAVNVDHHSSYSPPSTVAAHIQGGPDQDVPVDWTPAVNTDTVGTDYYYATVGTFTATLTVNVVATVSSLVSVEESVIRGVAYTMPHVIANMSDGSPQDLGNIWDPNTISTNVAGDFTSTATVAGKTATLTVHVLPNDADKIQTALGNITTLTVTNPGNRNSATDKPTIVKPSSVNGISFDFSASSATGAASINVSSGVVTRDTANPNGNQTGTITLRGTLNGTTGTKVFNVDIPRDKNNPANVTVN